MYEDDILNKYKYKDDPINFQNSNDDDDYENLDKENWNGSNEFKKYEDFDELEKEMLKRNINNDENQNPFNNKDKYNDFDYEKESKNLERLNKIAQKKLNANNFKSEVVKKENQKLKNNISSNKNSSKVKLDVLNKNNSKEKNSHAEKKIKKDQEYSIDNPEILQEIYKFEQEELLKELNHKERNKDNYKSKTDKSYSYNEDLEDPEREDMENVFELIKSLNELKDKNKKLETLNKYQSSKIEGLENELEKALADIRLKDLEIESLKSSGKTPNQENRKTLNQINTLNIQVDKLKSMLSEKKNDINGLIEKINEQQKMIDSHIIADRKHKQEMTNKNKQIARLIEEVDKINSNNNNYKNQGMISSNKDIEKLTNENKKLEKQKNELYMAFKKALKLCSILKRQKIHLENARLLAFTEEEFKQVLEQNYKN